MIHVTKSNITLVLIMVLLLFSLQNSFVNPESSQLDQSNLNSGEIEGIQYSYGEINYEDSGEFTYNANATAQETFSQSLVGTADIPLIEDFSINDVFYKIHIANFTASANTTDEVRINQNGLIDIINWINFTAPLTLDGDLATGRSLLKWNFTVGIELVDTKVKTATGDILGEFPQNTTYTEFFYNNGVEDVKSALYIVPTTIIVDVITTVHTVNYNQTIAAFGIMAYFAQYSMEYNISASAYQVNISDGENFGVGVTMFDRIDAEYLESFVSYFGYYFSSVVVTELKFANGTLVTDKGWGIPFNLLPVSYEASGAQVQAGFTHVSSSIVSTYQNIIAGFVSSANNSNETTVDLSARLAAWGLSTSTTMVAYNDGNENGRLDLNVGRNGLEVDVEDEIEAIGLAESYEVNVTNAYYISEEYNETINYWGLGITDEKENVNNTQLVVNQASFGIGDVDANTGLTPIWEEPTVTDEGTVVFNFGAEYNDFPVTWVNVTDGTTQTDNENITYLYQVEVDPSTGSARISPTWIYGGISDTGLKTDSEGLSLALLVNSEFFYAEAAYTATETDDPVNSTRSSTFTTLAVVVGDDSLTEIDATGPKKFYESNSVTYEANFDALRIITVTGSLEAEQVSPFSSESEDAAARPTTGGYVERLTIDFIYTLDLLIVNYPTWDGENITHDPDYNVNYQSVDRDNPPDDDTMSPTDDPSDTTPENSLPENDGDDVGLPGFGFSIAFVAVSTFTIIRKKKLV